MSSMQPGSSHVKEGMQERDWLLFVSDILCLQQELFWILLCPQLAIPTGLLAVVSCMMCVARCKTSAELMTEISSSVWTASNYVWLVGDLLWGSMDVAEKPLLSSAPFLGTSEALADAFRSAAVVGFLIGPLIMLLGFFRHRGRGRSITGNVVEQMQILTWSLKDCFWALELLWPAVFMDIITGLSMFIISSKQTVHNNDDCGDEVSYLWLASAYIWTVSELAFHGTEAVAFRYVAALLNLMAITFKTIEGPAIRDVHHEAISNDLSKKKD